MATLNIDYRNLILGHRYNVTYYNSYHNRNSFFTGNFNGNHYGTLCFNNVEGADEFMRVNGIPPNRIVSIHLYTNPQLPGGINQQINSYGGKRKSNRRKSRRSRKYEL